MNILLDQAASIGVTHIVICVDPKKLALSFAGRQFDKQFLKDLPDEVDHCGEYGEFHTFVYDGPMFSKAISCSVGAVVERSGFIFADVCVSNNGIRDNIQVGVVLAQYCQ